MSDLPQKPTTVIAPQDIADAGDDAVARAGRGGYARAGHHGDAAAEGDGIAIVGPYGRASATGAFGIALTAAHGTARSVENGLSVARGQDCSAISGAEGLAVAIGPAALVEVGSGGEAIALGPARLVRAGAGAIAIVLGAAEYWTQIEAEPGALVVIRHASTHGPLFQVARAGPGGIEPGRRHFWSDGALWLDRPFDAVRPRAVPEPTPWSDPPLAHDRSGGMIVLCPGQAYDAHRIVRAPKWDDEPASPTGLIGLPWGAGDPVAAGLLQTDQWMLVRVASCVVIDTAGTVKFAEGHALHIGTRAQVITQLSGMGVQFDRWHSPGWPIAGNRGIAVAEAGDTALAGRAGWALAPYGGNAEAGEDGVAITVHGRAQAGDGGLAIADGQGIASAGDRGVALSEGKRFGEASAGAEGVATGRGRFKTIRVQAGGAAVARAGAYATAGDTGVAVGRDGHVHAGRDGIAVCLGGTVSGDVGCLLVAANGDGTSVAWGIVGEGVIEPFTRYRANGDGLQSRE